MIRTSIIALLQNFFFVLLSMFVSFYSSHSFATNSRSPASVGSTISNTEADTSRCSSYGGHCNDQIDNLKNITIKAQENSSSHNISGELPNEPNDPPMQFALNTKECPSLGLEGLKLCPGESWGNLDIEARGELIYEGFKALLEAHALAGKYSPASLTCKAYKESTFDLKAQAKTSSAKGLCQVTKSTCIDLFKRGQWFSGKVFQFKNINDCDSYFNKMSQSPIAQMELGLAVIHQKSIDTGSNNMNQILKSYYGSGSETANENYANSIQTCAQCLKQKGTIERNCLEIVKGKIEKTTKNKESKKSKK